MKYVTAILESIIRFDCFIREYQSMVVLSERWDISTKCPTLHGTTQILDLSLYSYNVYVSCSL